MKVKATLKKLPEKHVAAAERRNVAAADEQEEDSSSRYYYLDEKQTVFILRSQFNGLNYIARTDQAIGYAWVIVVGVYSISER